MKPITKKQSKQVAKAILGLVVFLVLLNLLIPIIGGGEIVATIEGLGVFGPVAFVLYVVLSHVFAPLSASPLAVVSVPLFGYAKTLVYLMLGGFISSIINFYISKLYGRELVTKLVGKKSMKKVDEFTKVNGIPVLFLGRVIGSPFFDLISYAAGLTSMPFVVYYVTTVVGMVIKLFASLYLGTFLDFTNAWAYVIWLSLLVGFSIPFAILIKRSAASKKA